MRHIHLEQTNSTNAYLKDGYQNFDNLSFVSASYQSDGKGRENRTWVSNKNENALFSYIIKDPKVISQYPCLSIYTAMLVVDFIEKLGIKNVSIKWPNDVYINDKKVCGILLEGSIPNYVVVGVGLNVLQREFPIDLRTEATSLVLEGYDVTNVDKILEKLIDRLYSFWLTFSKKENSYENFINTHNYLLDKSVIVTQNNYDILGVVKSIDSNNNLLILDKENNLHKINSGEIKIR